MKENPLVTVAIPAYNAEDTIAETLESILSQRYQNLEVIVVDDGSRDATPSIVGRFAKSDDRVRLVPQQNQGVAVARNRGILEGRGDFIAPMDHDDIWHPEMIEKAMARLKSGGGHLGFVYAWYRCIDQDSVVIRDGPQYAFRGPALNRHLLVNPVRTGSGLLMTRSAALDAGLYDTSLLRAGLGGTEDLVLQLRIAEKYELDVIPEFLVGYRMGANTMSKHRARICFSIIKALRDKLDAHPEIHPALRRWTLGARYLRYSTALAGEGRILNAASAFAIAIALDPLDVMAGGAGLLQLGAHRLVKHGRHHVSAASPSTPGEAAQIHGAVGRRFQEFDPREASGRPSWNFVEMLRQARLKKLEAKDLKSASLQAASVAPKTCGPEPELKPG